MHRTRLSIPTRGLRRALGVLAAVAALVAAPAVTAAAADSPRPVVVASGLDNPRHVNVGPGGVIYVAEAGRGGDGPCFPSPEGGEACFGLTGAVTALDGRTQRRVVTGLASLANREGGSATGPADVLVDNGRRIAVLMGLGGTPELRAQLPAGGRKLGTVLSGRLGSDLRIVADPATFEGNRDPAGDGVDTNPTGFVRSGTGWAVADAGGNDLVRLTPASRRTLAVFPDRLVPSPFPGPPEIPMEAVPTSVSVGPDGAYYVSQLTGFPFPVGGASIWRVVPGQAPTVFATGLTNVTDLEWHEGVLYAVQLADAGLLGPAPIGSLRRVVPGASAHPVVAGELFAPFGVAVRDKAAFVTTCSVCAGGGQVVRIPL